MAQSERAIARLTDCRRITAADWASTGRYDWLRGVRRSGALNSTDKLVATALALEFAGKNMKCFPGVEAIAAECAISERAAKRALIALEAGRWIMREGGGGRGNRAAIYFLARAEIVALKGVAGDTVSASERVSSVTPFKAQTVSSVVVKGVIHGQVHIKAQPRKNTEDKNDDPSIETASRIVASGVDEIERKAREIWARLDAARFVDRDAVPPEIWREIVGLGMSMLAPHGQGAAKNFYPDRATFLGFAHLVAPRPLTDDPKLLGWFASVEGPKMIAEGTLVETWSFFERHRRPPFDDRSRRLVAEQAAENKRRVLLIDERVDRGVEVDPEDRAFVLRYRARQVELGELVVSERAKRGRG